jgi:hypothetical protein
MSTHDEPVTRRMRIPRKHTSSGTRGRWQPRGCEVSGGGRSGSIVCQMTVATSGSSARVMLASASAGHWVVSALASNARHTNDRWMVTYPRGS